MENSEENGGEEEGLVRSCYRLVIVKRVFTMFTSGAEKREIFRPGRRNFRPLHNTIPRNRRKRRLLRTLLLNLNRPTLPNRYSMSSPDLAMVF